MRANLNLMRTCHLVATYSIIAFVAMIAPSFAQVLDLSLKPPFRLKDTHVFETGERWSVGGFGSFVTFANGKRSERKISDADLNSLFVVNDTAAIAVGNAGEILLTTDRGISWTKSPSPTKVNLKSVYCIDVQECWIAGGERGVVLFGGILGDVAMPPGRTGSAQAQPAKRNRWSEENIVSGGSFEDIFFVNKNVGFAAGEAGLLLKTEDAGENWFRITVPMKIRVSAHMKGLPNFESVSFVNENNGCVAGWDVGTGVVACTNDGGDTWKSSLIRANPLGIVWYDAGRKVVLVDEYGENLESRDLGSTWSTMKSNDKFISSRAGRRPRSQK